jgi:hypothetical protein
MPKTDEDVLRELLHRATDDLYPPSAVTAGIVTRHQRRLRNTRILSITTTSVAAVAVVAALVVARVGPSALSHAQHSAVLPGTVLPGTVLPGTELPPIKLTAVQVLDQLSVAAGRAPQPAGRYIALTENDQGQGSKRTIVFDSLTGDVWAYQHGSEVPRTIPVSRHWSPTRAEFAAWPTNPARLRALLLSQGNQAGADDEEGVQSETIQGATPDDLVFQEATSWLWNPLLSPSLRSAMYKVLAATSGVTVKAGTTDVIGRPAIEISRRDSDERYTTYESPSTGAVLEQDFSEAGGAALYTAVTGYATRPANPYSGG